MFLAAGALSFAAFSGEARAYRIAGLDTATLQSGSLLPLGRLSSPSYYTAVADTALALQPPDLKLAEQATTQAILRNDRDVNAWNRLAYIDIRQNGQLTRDGMAALYQSYAASPYGDLALMTWRVDFATGTWAALPDDLRARTLAQIPVIGRFGISWDWRVKACRENPHKEIYQAVCAIAPGVVRPGTPPQG